MYKITFTVSNTISIKVSLMTHNKTYVYAHTHTPVCSMYVNMQKFKLISVKVIISHVKPVMRSIISMT